MKIINYNEITGNNIFVDMRTVEEYIDGSIVGAINIPLFNHEQRAEIGTMYKKDAEKAKILGIKYVSEQLPDIYEKITNLSKNYDHIIIFCERGGMRSGSVCALLDALGVNIIQLYGGYKEYRRIVIEELVNLVANKEFCVLHGFTGTGKTELLTELRKKDIPVLDLEKAADHRGSMLGKIGLSKHITQKSFESTLHHILKNTKEDFILLEAESKRIGMVNLPEYFYEHMKNGKHILVNASMPERAKRIVEDYTASPTCKDELLSVMDRFRKGMGNALVDELVELIKKEQFYQASIILMEKYYDPLYSHTQNQYNYDLTIDTDNIEKAIKQTIDFCKIYDKL